MKCPRGVALRAGVRRAPRPRLQLSALVPRLFEGRELPDAAVLQQWLNVLVTGPVWGVGQAPADAVAMLLDSAAFAVLRDE